MRKPSNPLDALFKALGDTLCEEAATEFITWFASSDAPDVVKGQIAEIIEDLELAETGMIVLAATQWARAVMKNKIEHAIEVRDAQRRVAVVAGSES